MEVRNIKVFQGQPVVINAGDEKITIKRVPALATLTLYTNEKLVASLMGLDLSGVDDKSEQAKKLYAQGQTILRIITEHYENVLHILACTLKRDTEWVEENLGHLAMIEILFHILSQNIEESMDAVKKNGMTL